MTPQICKKCQSSFSAYLDGAVSGRQMQKIARHWRLVPTASTSSPPYAPCSDRSPALALRRLRLDLGLKLRLAISHEQARRKSSWLDTLSVKWDNAIRPMLVQVSAGFAGAVIFVGGIGLLLGMVAAPEPAWRTTSR